MNDIDVDQAAASAYELAHRYIEILNEVTWDLPTPHKDIDVRCKQFFEYLTGDGSMPFPARLTGARLALRSLEKNVSMRAKLLKGLTSSGKGHRSFHGPKIELDHVTLFQEAIKYCPKIQELAGLVNHTQPKVKM